MKTLIYPKCFCFIILIIFFYIAERNIYASEKELIDLAKAYNANGEYYNAITEIMRAGFLYPGGKYYPAGMLIKGEAYYRGWNYRKAVDTFTECGEKFRQKPEGEKAFYSVGYVNMIMGPPYLALQKYREYRYLYKDGLYREDVSRDLCYTMLLMKDFRGAKDAIKEYETSYADGKYIEEIKNLEARMDEEAAKPKKSLWLSVFGSMLVPGFGHFYTGKYDLGILSLVSNALFIYLFYDGYRDKSKIRMAVFGVAEFSVYQYSLYTSISDVYEYNKRDEFYKSVRLGAAKEF